MLWHQDSHYLSAEECITAGFFQNKHSNPCRLSRDGYFGSKFVTVVATGEFVTSGNHGNQPRVRKLDWTVMWCSHPIILTSVTEDTCFLWDCSQQQVCCTHTPGPITQQWHHHFTLHGSCGSCDLWSGAKSLFLFSHCFQVLRSEMKVITVSVYRPTCLCDCCCHGYRLMTEKALKCVTIQWDWRFTQWISV